MRHTTVELLLPLFHDAVEMLSLTRASFRRYDAAQVDIAMALGRAIHKQEKELTEQLLANPPEIDGLRFVPSHLERISDAVQGLLRCLRTRETEAMVFTEGGAREIEQLFDRAMDLLECARDLALTRNRVLAHHVEIESMRFHDLASAFARAHEARLVEGVCMPEASSTYLSMADYLREVTRHARRICARLVPQETTTFSARRVIPGMLSEDQPA
jgi:Na+/phosphate symporter